MVKVSPAHDSIRRRPETFLPPHIAVLIASFALAGCCSLVVGLLR
jgi:hypothetical protein